MTDRQKWQEIVDKVESLKDQMPATYQMWQQIMAELNPKIEQALQKSEEDTKIHTGGN